MCFRRPLHPCPARVPLGDRPRPHDVVDAVLARLAERRRRPAWISLVEPAVLRARADELEALPTDLPLYGVPFAVKDNIDVDGLPTTAACPAFAYTPGRTPAASRGCSPRARSSSARPTSTSSPPASTAPAPPTARRRACSAAT